MKLFKTTILILAGLLVSASTLSAQDTTASPLASIHVLVTDFKNNSKQGEQLLFEGMNSGKIFKRISDQDGQFDIQLPGGDTYLIKIKSIGEAKDYEKVSIPALKKGEYYRPMQLTVKFEPPKVFTLNNVHFDSGKSTLKQSSYTELNELLEFMQLKSSVVIEIRGHTDNVGEPDSNLKLSQARAEAVKSFLVSKGIAPGRIIAKGYGEDDPIDTNNTPEGRQNNRRTEVKIIKE